MREDKPLTGLRMRVLLGDGTVVLDGIVACYAVPLAK